MFCNLSSRPTVCSSCKWCSVEIVNNNTTKGIDRLIDSSNSIFQSSAAACYFISIHSHLRLLLGHAASPSCQAARLVKVLLLPHPFNQHRKCWYPFFWSWYKCNVIWSCSIVVPRRRRWWRLSFWRLDSTKGKLSTVTIWTPTNLDKCRRNHVVT